MVLLVIRPFQTHSLDNMKFTTKDKDNDLSSYRNCAITSGPGSNGGGWWYRDCSHVHINHRYPIIRMYLNGISQIGMSFTA